MLLQKQLLKGALVKGSTSVHVDFTEHRVTEGGNTDDCMFNVYSGAVTAYCPIFVRYYSVYLARCGLPDDALDHLQMKLRSAGIRTAFTSKPWSPAG